MSRPELTNGVWVVRAASWTIWSFIFSTMLIYSQVPSWGLSTSDYSPYRYHILVGCAIVWSLLLLSMVFVLRYFGLKKPAKKGTYSPYTLKGITRLALLGIIFWAVLDIFSATGIVLYLISGQAWPIYSWVIVGLIFMCYFSPRLKPYDKAAK
jgi:hypothetical protein